MKDFKQVFNILPSNGWLDESEALALWNYAEGKIIEVGGYYGRSTVLLANKGSVITIDPFDGFDSTMSGDEVEKKFKENTKSLGVKLIRKKVEEVKPRGADFVYLDGDHTYEGTINQIKFALACNPKFIAVHDVNDVGEGAEIKRACLELLGPWDNRFRRLALWKRK